MPFKEGNKFGKGRRDESEELLDPSPVCLKLSREMRAKLKGIPGWQNKLREELPKLIEKWSNEKNEDNSDGV